MGSAGETFNVGVQPVGAKQLLPSETIAPNHLELRNGVRTDAGFFKGRPGYAEEWNTEVSLPIVLLIPFRRVATNGFGYAILSDGTIYEVLANNQVQVYSGPGVNGTFRPCWDVFDGIPIIVSGQAPVKIRVDETLGNYHSELLGGSPPAARFISVIADRVVLSGQNDTQFNWSDAGNAEIWPQQNFSNVTGHGQRIRMQYTIGTDLWFFKDYDIEIWAHIGGDEVFGRSAIIPIMDKKRGQRGLSGFSVVVAGDPMRAFFYADGDFWSMNGPSPSRISLDYKREVGNLPNVTNMYGYDFAKEHVIRWFEPISGRCFVFDYRNLIFTEDNKWIAGAWERLPIYSYMEVDDRAYIGDYDPTGRIYEWDDDIFTDAGAPIRVYRQLRVLLDPKTQHNCRFNRVRFRMERGQGAIGSAPTLQVRWAMDGADFTPHQSLSMGESSLTVGESGNYDPYIEIQNLGVGREALMEVVQYAGVRHVMTHMDVTARKLGR